MTVWLDSIPWPPCLYPVCRALAWASGRLNGIVAALAEWLTARQAMYPKGDAPEGPVDGHGVFHIVRAAGVESAKRRQRRREQKLIGAYHLYEDSHREFSKNTYHHAALNISGVEILRSAAPTIPASG